MKTPAPIVKLPTQNNGLIFSMREDSNTTIFNGRCEGREFTVSYTPESTKRYVRVPSRTHVSLTGHSSYEHRGWSIADLTFVVNRLKEWVQVGGALEDHLNKYLEQL